MNFRDDFHDYFDKFSQITNNLKKIIKMLGVGTTYLPVGGDYTSI